MNIYQWSVEILLAVFWVYSLYAALNPEATVKFTIRRNMSAMKFYGFKASMKPSKRSENIIQKGHIIVLILLTIYMALVYLFGNTFMLQLIK
jgi:hypothetical protein